MAAEANQISMSNPTTVAHEFASYTTVGVTVPDAPPWANDRDRKLVALYEAYAKNEVRLAELIDFVTDERLSDAERSLATLLDRKYEAFRDEVTSAGNELAKTSDDTASGEVVGRIKIPSLSAVPLDASEAAMLGWSVAGPRDLSLLGSIPAFRQLRETFPRAIRVTFTRIHFSEINGAQNRAWEIGLAVQFGGAEVARFAVPVLDGNPNSQIPDGRSITNKLPHDWDAVTLTAFINETSWDHIIGGGQSIMVVPGDSPISDGTAGLSSIMAIVEPALYIQINHIGVAARKGSVNFKVAIALRE